MSIEAPQALLEVRNLVKHFPVDAGLFSNSTRTIKALNGIDLTIHRGTTLGLVGESGCGKTTTARLLLRLHERDQGTMFLDPCKEDFFKLDQTAMKRERLRMQYIFQDPYGSLNPKMQVRHVVTEPLEVFRRYQGQKLGHKERDQVAAMLCERVGLDATSLSRYPHEFSGGQRQRLAIARALSVRPSLIICDEPVSSLDVSIQSQILNLLNEIQQQDKVSYLFIGHNLPVVFYVSDVVAVMYAGRIVEQAPARDLSDVAYHPYTRALRAASAGRLAAALPADTATNAQDWAQAACAFASRCPLRSEQCMKHLPLLAETGKSGSGHLVACHNAAAG